MAIEKYLKATIGSKPSVVSDKPSFTGKWVNTLDSEMELAVSITGELTGSYKTGVGAPQPTEEFDLKGFVSGDLIVFCVNFGKFDSLTSWAGQHTRDESGNEVIHTLWHLAQNVRDADEPSNLWAGILTGANEFRRSA